MRKQDYASPLQIQLTNDNDFNEEMIYSDIDSQVGLKCIKYFLQLIFAYCNYFKFDIPILLQNINKELDVLSICRFAYNVIKSKTVDAFIFICLKFFL